MKNASGLPSVRPVPEPAAWLDVVGLELLARAAAVARLTPGQIATDQLVVELEPGGQRRDHHRQPGAVRLTRCDVGEFHEPRAYPPVVSDLRKNTRSNPSSRRRSMRSYPSDGYRRRFSVMCAFV